MDPSIIQALLAAFAQQNGQNVGQQPSGESIYYHFGSYYYFFLEGKEKNQNGRKEKGLVPPNGSRKNVLSYMDNGSGKFNF
jgi:hypothetical protein